eukprot:scaffold7029_cov375-Pinguiococcus_pyrenoidosus.AAC.22
MRNCLFRSRKASTFLARTKQPEVAFGQVAIALQLVPPPLFRSGERTMSKRCTIIWSTLGRSKVSCAQVAAECLNCIQQANVSLRGSAGLPEEPEAAAPLYQAPTAGAKACGAPRCPRRCTESAAPRALASREWRKPPLGSHALCAARGSGI